jgi:hypothetical protein
VTRGERAARFGRVGAGWCAAPHPRPFPHKQRGGRVTRDHGSGALRKARLTCAQPAGARSNSPLISRAAGERGRGRGGRVGRSSIVVETSRSCPHQPPQGFWGRWASKMRARRGRAIGRMPSGAGSNSPLSPAQRGRGAGGEGARRAQCDNGRSQSILPHPTSPRGFWGRWASLASPEGACPSRRTVHRAPVPQFTHALTHSRTNAPTH